MTYHCDNCGQAALETDTICWHCGRSLAQREAKEKSLPAAGNEEKERPLPLTRISAYAGLTLAIVIALLAVMNALGQQPQVIQGISSSLKPGWITITDQNRVFTLNLPSAWQRLDRYDSEQQAELIKQVHQNNQYQAALSPYDDMADDRQLLFLAAANQTNMDTAVPPFIVIARSQQLGQLSPEQMTVLLREGPSGVKLLRSNLAEGINGRRQALSILTMFYIDQELRCQHLFTYETAAKENPDGFLVVGCASEDAYNDYTNVFHEILVSFQPLLP